MPKNQSLKNNDSDQDEQPSESYISVGLGILVVVVVGILLYNFFTQKQSSKDEITTADKTSDEASVSAQTVNSYTVKEGDTLWSIAENVYKNGYNWIDLAKANNLTENQELKVGQKIIVPSPEPIASASVVPLSSAIPTASTDSQQANNPKSISESSYTVVSGDTLWDIACRAYGDCYAWPKIAQANKLVDPDIIHIGNILVLPR